MAILNDLSAMSKEQLIARLMEAEKPRAITMKVAEKGGLSIYGLGRFPVTLYAGQWERLLAPAQVAAITAFIAANAATLSRK